MARRTPSKEQARKALRREFKALGCDEVIARIASEKLGIETLEERGRDHLDFHDIGVTRLREALIAAYEAGRKAGAR